MITRDLRQKIIESPKSVLILGPRQVGKSTLVESLNPDLTINLAHPKDFLDYGINPELLENVIAQNEPKLIFIDEIQKAPQLLDMAQFIIDKHKKKYKFILSGSSARKLKRNAANLLPGRVFSYRLGPLNALELNFKMNSKKCLEIGTLPEPYLEKNRANAEKLLRSYSATYLHEEIASEAIVRQIQGFSRFLSIAAESSGHFLDFSKLANKAKVNRSAARRYYEILEDTLICDRLEAYPNESLDLVKHSKFFLFDVGVRNALLENFTVSADRIGLSFEHLFFNQLKNVSYALDVTPKIYHFRTRGGFEVDFIIQYNKRTLAVELKAGEANSEDVKKLEGLSTYINGPIEYYIACVETRSQKIKNTQILPWQQVLKKIFHL